jgi:ketosteroid isomerase-like protein
MLDAGELLQHMYYPEMLKYLADDVEYNLPISLDGIGGTHKGIDAVSAMLHQVFTHFYDPAQVAPEIKTAFATENFATMIFVMNATLRWGEQYQNLYCISIETSEGKITKIHEFLDTKHLMDSIDADKAAAALAAARQSVVDGA